IREVMNEVQGKTKARGEETMQTETVKRVTSMEELREARKRAAHRKRRIIFNNDGNESVYYMNEATPKAFLDCRTTSLLGSQVDSIFYCTWSSGFGMFTHDTKVGEVFSTTVNPKHPHNKGSGFAKNKTAELIAKGIDPLKLTVGFCKQHKLEVFWSFRMNDTHDAWGSWYGEHLFPQLKKDHPEWMVSERKDPAKRGSTDVKDYNRSKHGGWTAMDFNHQEVRDLAVKLFEEVCENYDVDGIEMDFFRHPIYFKGPAWSKDASQDELGKLTDMARQIRKMTERVGLKRGRPILVGIRVPDSIDYCRAMGIDVERWLAEGLVDVMAVTGYFRLNPWSVSVDLGKRYGVPVYASLSETRIRDGAAKKLRASQACYRGRAAVAWGSGVDGIYMFNSFNPKSPLWRQLGDPAGLQGLDKAYVIGARGVRVINSWMKDGEKRFLSRPSLSPERPVKLQPGKLAEVELQIAGLPKQRSAIEGILRVRVKDLADATVQVAFNGQVLANGVTAAPWTDYTLDPKTLREGTNSVTVTLPAESAAKAVWMDVAVQVKRSTKWQGIPE
ncbi:MAG: family 10 glycosylhydrolase, partial [Lentisphaeria bacterium]|nr:family 10 glycosylhydrolase [Lentisphaeria bacterium]